MRSYLYLIGLAIVAVLSTWFLWTVQETLTVKAAKNDDTPFLFMENFQATRMNEQGIRQYRLSSPYLVYLANDQGTQVSTPHIELFQKDGQNLNWTLRAEQAWLSADNDEIQLQQQVIAQQIAAPDKLLLTITTADVVIRPKQQLIESDQPVHLASPNGEFKGVGLKADLDKQQVELLANVRGHYQPASD